MMLMKIASTPAQEYFIPPYIKWCHANGVMLLLDLRSDRYLAIDQDQLRALKGRVRIWEVFQPSTLESSGEGEEIACEMLARGILSTDASQSGPLPPVLPEGMTSVTHADLVSCAASIRASHVLAMFLAWVTASLKFKLLSLRGITSRREARKGRISQVPSVNRDASVLRLAAIYCRLRPFFISVKHHCLLDSLMLSEFLARYDLYPPLVIAVAPHPFKAHSWVQLHDVVLNDTNERTRSYVPIHII
jgi:Transglutaminase-like superfamily